MPGKRHSKAAIREFFRLVHGVGIQAACAKTGVPRRTGLYWLRIGERAAIRAATPVRYGHKHDVTVAELKAANPSITQTEIAKTIGVSRQRVSVIVRRMRIRRA